MFEIPESRIEQFHKISLSGARAIELVLPSQKEFSSCSIVLWGALVKKQIARTSLIAMQLWRLVRRVDEDIHELIMWFRFSVSRLHLLHLLFMEKRDLVGPVGSPFNLAEKTNLQS